MANIAEYWYVWALAMFGGYGYAMVNQLQRLKRMAKNPLGTVAATFGEGDVDTTADPIFKGMATMFIAAGIGFCGMILLFIAIAVYLKAA